MISFWFSKGGDCVDQQDVVDRVYARYRGRVNFLSLDIRDDRDTVRELIRAARLEDAGRLRPRRRGRRPLPGRRLPDLRLRLSRRDAAERQHRQPRRAAQLSDGSSGCCGATPRRGGGLRWAPRRPARAARLGARPEAGLGRPARCAAEFPGLGICLDRGRRPPGRSPEPVERRLREPLRPLLRRPRDPHARTADPLGLPRLLPPDRPRPRPHPHPGRAARPRPPPGRRLQEPRPARRRADDRHGRDRRSRCAPSTPSGSRARSASATRLPASRWRAGPASCRRGRW